MDPDLMKGKIKKTIEEFSEEWTGILLFPTPKESYTPCKERVAGLSSFFSIIWRQKGRVLHIVLSSLFITFLGIGSSYYFQGILEYFILNQAKSTLNTISVGLIVTHVFSVLFEYSRSYLLVILGQRMSMMVMLQYFKHVLTLPMNFFSTRKSGEIISRFLDINIYFFRHRYGSSCWNYVGCAKRYFILDYFIFFAFLYYRNYSFC
ncbi:ATP-binding cassette, subfamily C, bacteriocin exporter [Enterococcus sp. DIV0421]